MKKKLLIGSFVAVSFGFSMHASALENGDVLNITQGEVGCMLGGVFPNCLYGQTIITSGSFFSMDTDGNGQFSPSESTPIGPGGDGGIVIGTLQPGLSSSGCTQGGKNGLIDAPWCFFGNTGVHQTILNPVTYNGDGTLDFSGWGVTWNGIPNIDLSGYQTWGDTGKATISCSTPACLVGDKFILDYTAHVKPYDPSGFGGLYYGVHLEGFVGVVAPVADVQINITGGQTQECTTSGGSDVAMNAVITIPDDDNIDSIEWMIDGQAVASGEYINPFLTLGSHSVEVNLTTANGLTDSATRNIIIRDTTPPVVSADFINRFTQMSVTELQRFNFIRIKAAAQDVCDPDPVVEAMIGAPVQNGDAVYIMKNLGNVSLNLSKIDLSVRATDNQNNSSTGTATINIGN